MCELYYVGFNGYRQCPENENCLPKVITDWTCIKEVGVPITCTHRFLVTETKDSLRITGTLNKACKKVLHVLPKPAENSHFESCDRFLYASEGRNIWVKEFKNSFEDNWMKLDLVFVYENQKNFWDKILKLSFQPSDSDVLVLLSNGSVWILSSRNALKILYQGEADKAVDISSGLEHSLILTESGCVLAFGNGSRGQLGTGDLEPSLEPIQILALEGLKITKIATGGWHSCALTDSGDFYTWGWNNYGQLSAFEDDKEVSLTALPTLVDVGDDPDLRIVDVACGRRHTVAILENNEIFVTGWNIYSQLGLNSPCEKISKFTKTSLQKGVNGKVICGPWYTILVKESPSSK